MIEINHLVRIGKDWKIGQIHHDCTFALDDSLTFRTNQGINYGRNKGTFHIQAHFNSLSRYLPSVISGKLYARVTFLFFNTSLDFCLLVVPLLQTL